jgi:hypothetical protein
MTFVKLNNNPCARPAYSLTRAGFSFPPSSPPQPQPPRIHALERRGTPRADQRSDSARSGAGGGRRKKDMILVREEAKLAPSKYFSNREFSWNLLGRLAARRCLFIANACQCPRRARGFLHSPCIRSDTSQLRSRGTRETRARSRE